MVTYCPKTPRPLRQLRQKSFLFTAQEINKEAEQVGWRESPPAPRDKAQRALQDHLNN